MTEWRYEWLFPLTWCWRRCQKTTSQHHCMIWLCVTNKTHILPFPTWLPTKEWQSHSHAASFTDKQPALASVISPVLRLLCLPQGCLSKSQGCLSGQGVETVNLFILGFIGHDVTGQKKAPAALQTITDESKTMMMTVEVRSICQDAAYCSCENPFIASHCSVHK